MLYIQDQGGGYVPATKDAILSEAERLRAYQLWRGAYVESSTAAKAAIRDKLHAHDSEVFACLFLDSSHKVLAWNEMFRGTINQSTVYPREIVK